MQCNGSIVLVRLDILYGNDIRFFFYPHLLFLHLSFHFQNESKESSQAISSVFCHLLIYDHLVAYWGWGRSGAIQYTPNTPSPYKPTPLSTAFDNKVNVSGVRHVSVSPKFHAKEQIIFKRTLLSRYRGVILSYQYKCIPICLHSVWE